MAATPPRPSQRIGEGKFGETRWYNGAITPIGNYVAIKRFKDLTPTGRREAEDEANYHLQVWQNSSCEAQAKVHVVQLDDEPDQSERRDVHGASDDW